MSIINVTPGQTGLVGVLPSIAYIDTSLATNITSGLALTIQGSGFYFI